MNKILTGLKYRILYFYHCRIYVPIFAVYLKATNKPGGKAPKTFPCQICGKEGHIERFCPKAKELGFFDTPDQREI